MCLASFFMCESPVPVRPPVAFRFCTFSPTQVLNASGRCPHCSVLQPKECA